MGDFNHRHIRLKFLESIGGEDQQFLFFIQDSLIPYTQHVCARTNQGRECIELVDNLKIHEPLGNNDHNQIHFNYVCITKRTREGWTIRRQCWKYNKYHKDC